MKFIEKGTGRPIILLHGLFGNLSNWNHQITFFSKTYKVIVPELNFDIPRNEKALNYLAKELYDLVVELQLDDIILVGNSLGGHLALVFTHMHPEHVSKLVLTGSSGLFENTLNGTYPRRNSRKYIKERVEYTFYDPKIATDNLLAEVLNVVRDNTKCFNIIRMAKEAQRNTLKDTLHLINTPTMLIWGKNDKITPPDVALEFEDLMPNCELYWLDNCGHAPMMEHPYGFNELLQNYILKNEN